MLELKIEKCLLIIEEYLLPEGGQFLSQEPLSESILMTVYL